MQVDAACMTEDADELSPEELQAGCKRLEKKARGYEPQAVAVLGIGAYRTAFKEPKAALGLQARKLGSSLIWVLPNPSGLNAHYQLADLAEQFRMMREFLEEGRDAR